MRRTAFEPIVEGRASLSFLIQTRTTRTTSHARVGLLAPPTAGRPHAGLTRRSQCTVARRAALIAGDDIGITWHVEVKGAARICRVAPATCRGRRTLSTVCNRVAEVNTSERFNHDSCRDVVERNADEAQITGPSVETAELGRVPSIHIRPNKAQGKVRTRQRSHHHAIGATILPVPVEGSLLILPIPSVAVT